MRIIGIFPCTCLVFGVAIFFHDLQNVPSVDAARADVQASSASKDEPLKSTISKTDTQLALARGNRLPMPEKKAVEQPPSAPQFQKSQPKDELLEGSVKTQKAKRNDDTQLAPSKKRADQTDDLLLGDGGPPKTNDAKPARQTRKVRVKDELLGEPLKAQENAPRNMYAKASQDDDLLLGDGGPPKVDGVKPQRQIRQARANDDLLGSDKGPKKSRGTLLGKPEPRMDESGYKKKTASVSPDADTESEKKKKKLTADEEHVKLFVENRYPSANACGTCHPKHYKEWSVSQHAYAQLSPIYLSLSNKINALSNGSNGDFCLRCHTPVGANLGESSFASNLDRHPTSREGITCVVCHRINKAYNKVSGRLALVEGGLTDVVFGPKGNKGVKQTLANPKKFRVVTDPKEPGRQIHKEAKLFNAISTPTFCGSCHDVTLFNGFRLEEAFSEYRMSPAAAKGVTCNDCHMGKIQGKVSGYDRGPAAVVGDVPTKPRKLTSHLFSGPDYSVIHPGIFPHNQEAAAFKTMREWLQFKHKAGWGTDRFENKVPANYKFPKAWASIDDRYDARAIINKQLKLLKYAKKKRREVLRNGFVLSKAIIDRADKNGLAFRVKVKNGTDGHNVPTGFTGERLVWLEVTVRDRKGKVVFRSGDRDANGDVRDGHSSYVHAGKVDQDPYLFSLQSIFLTQNGRGGEIEHVIPIPFPSFALPRVLPSTSSLVFTGEPATERVHKKGIEPNGHRWAKYKVSGSALTGHGPYKATIKLKAQAVPINLISAIQDVGFDFGMTPREVGDALIAGTQTLWNKKLVFDVKKVQ